MPSEVDLIEEYAALFLTVDEIAALLDVDVQELRRELKGMATVRAKAYHRGKLRTTIELRRQTLQFAQKGSPQAEQAMLDFWAKQKLSENG